MAGLSSLISPLSEQQPAEIRPTSIEVAWPVMAGLGVRVLTSRFEAARSLSFWDHGQMTRATPELPPHSRSFHTTPAGGSWSTAYDLDCNRPHTRRIFSEIRFRTWNLPPPEADTSPLGNHSPYTVTEKEL
ncbi:hypothetical protein AVEN_145677-1 [Araneus ventricosus]|uniref:Uncharacterized protein n=1 Tax=Araneus ventricosus TaxID=182803 RepID=A0A4Y1ZZ03_ARAVE|nr:hypothetical protein AVEN_197180-1 [Araneus ventricosus]GBL72732.1 hypothetical protein AVEN_127039-1 [Araneus ventricosus]GBL73259.1 hypothetical protein AVEN_124009-1 [Araneus ventricosus]GBL73267.1 hypothetical protein AVEN_145677-1 [Araneus ventricosus]